METAAAVITCVGSVLLLVLWLGPALERIAASLDRIAASLDRIADAQDRRDA